MRVELKPAAVADVAAALKYYEDARSGLAREFLDAFDAVLGRLALFPEGATTVEGSHPVRRASLRRFPFGVFYLPEDERIVVLRVMHSARHPEDWPDVP